MGNYGNGEEKAEGGHKEVLEDVFQAYELVKERGNDPYMSYKSNLALLLMAWSCEFQARKDYKLQVYS